MFRDSLTFNNRVFSVETDFSESVFHRAPRFHNCELHQDTDFRATTFLDTRSVYAARAYRTLKLAMGEQRARNEEGLFYALEQRSLRSQSGTPMSTKIVSLLYETAADYGRSFLRPLMWLGIATGVFLLIYLWIGSMWGIDLHAHGSQVLVFTIEQIVRPFYIWTVTGADTAKDVFGRVPLFLRFLATLESVLGLSAVALFLLALRWQFRRG